LILISAFPPKAVHADVAPPEAPPGTNLIPGNETTQVRMVAETVTLTISKDPAHSQEAIAKTEAVFTMRNLGTAEENMQVRFPLSFFNGNSDGFGNFPERVFLKSDPKGFFRKPKVSSQYSGDEGTPSRRFPRKTGCAAQTFGTFPLFFEKIQPKPNFTGIRRQIVVFVSKGNL
jgi:hypothetical protein